MSKYVVRYGSMRILRPFASAGKNCYARGDRVIVRTDRGLESGVILCEAAEGAAAKTDALHEGQVLRKMTAEDENELARIHNQEKAEFEVCQRCIRQLALEMRLVDVEHIFGGERIVVYYLAEGRVDFRELVKMLAGEFQTRIEMRQIGVRDEAKLMADYGDCGQPVCCNNHLVSMPPVSMKMAKLQKATLDPTKISGRCGRLKCCLRYEFDTYESMLAELPPIGASVETPDGQARVVGHEILTRQLVVELEDRVRKSFDAEEVAALAAENRPKRRRTPSRSQ
ncbi:MAG: signal peptidase [Pirellulaceae bacterium]|mgnify:CR=1 FL=1|jgi:cell fate regulator YaaT (PSP1 superfamily)|nr:signal peptidase [Pirellulaceae bacterium]